MEQQFTAPQDFDLWPQAHLHTQWPGSGLQGDPTFDNFMRETNGSVPTQEVLNTASGAALPRARERPFVPPLDALTAHCDHCPLAVALQTILAETEAKIPAGAEFFYAIKKEVPAEGFRIHSPPAKSLVRTARAFTSRKF